LELAVELVGWAVSWLGHLGKPVWVVVDGAYAKAPFLKPMRALKVTTVSRLRKDSALWTVPGPRAPHRRGPNRTYGEQRIDLAKRAGQTRGWTIGAFHLCLWTFTMTEAWAWNRDEKALIEHRSASPWDNGARRPSHADKRRSRRRELLGNEIRAVLRPGAAEQELQAAAERMLQLAA
jgi:DDE superfamily endonuclease